MSSTNQDQTDEFHPTEVVEQFKLWTHLHTFSAQRSQKLDDFRLVPKNVASNKIHCEAICMTIL